MHKDRIYQSQQTDIAPFEFNQEVVHVFEDMISRSVPGYRASIELAMILASEICQAGDHIYDLGCSLGAASFALLHQRAMPQVNVSAVDISKPMLVELASRIQDNTTTLQTIQFPVQFNNIQEQNHSLSLLLEDITTTSLKPSKLILLNYVLQFIPLEARTELLHSIYEALPQGGILLLSEKIKQQDPAQQTLLDTLHLRFKRLQGYSDMEIHGKRAALERVLIPETIEAHEQRLKEAGFQRTSIAVSQLNFVSIIAMK